MPASFYCVIPKVLKVSSTLPPVDCKPNPPKAAVVHVFSLSAGMKCRYWPALARVPTKQPFSRDSRDSVACGCLHSNSFDKITFQQENTMALKDELVPTKNHAKKLPKVPSEILEKQPFSRDSVACGCLHSNSFDKITFRQENTMALKDELVPKPRQKTAKRSV